MMRPAPVPAWRDQRFWLFCIGWAVTVAVVVHFAIVRSGR